MSLWTNLVQIAERLFDPADGARCATDRDAAFTIGVISLAAKLARADGVVTGDEIAAFRRVFQSPPGAEREVARVFDLARRTTLGFEGHARMLARRFDSCPGVLEDVLDALWSIAAADGAVAPAEAAYLETCAEIFDLPEATRRKVEARWVGHRPGDPFAILGVDHDADEADVRRAYRALAAAHHPDAFAARGLPSEAEQLATERMAAINTAYRQIKEMRSNLSPSN